MLEFLPVEWHDSLDSTNTYLRKLAVEDLSLASGKVVAARSQTAGRGRQGRSWVSASGRDLAFSFFYRARTDMANLPSMTQAVALGVAEVLRRLGLEPSVKWPNDVLVGGRKICGILTEHIPEAGCMALVVGVGININMTAADMLTVEAPVTSLFLETGSEIPVETVLWKVMGELPHRIDMWEQGGFSALRKEWESFSPSLGDIVRVRHGKGHRLGKLAGFGEYGELLIVEDDGTVRPVWSGDVSFGKTI